MADLVKKEADKTKRIGDIQRSITKNTSATSLRSKDRQIERYQKDLSRVLSDKADINKKIADKRMRLADATVKLQKEETTHAKSLAKQQEKGYITYQKQISDLTKQIKAQENLVSSKENLFDSSGAEEYDVFVSHAKEEKSSFCKDSSRN